MTWTDFVSSETLSRLKHPSNRKRLLRALDAEIAKAEREAWDKEAAARSAYTRDAASRLEEIRARCSTLHGFVQEAWPILEPSTPFVDGWVMQALCKHLEAVSAGKITRLLINVPPGMSKSLLVSVLWPAWEWGPGGRPGLRYLATSFSEPNVVRDNDKMRRLIESEWFQALWPNVKPSRRWATKKFENTSTGGRDGRPMTKMTGGRGDVVILDDPHSVDGAESDTQRKATIRTFRESISDRLNDIVRSSIVVIMQRIHAADVSGTILELGLPYVHLCLPMEFEPDRRCETFLPDGTLLFRDPRTFAGELLFPQRFPRDAVNAMKLVKGAYAYAGQYQQRPSPREGGLFDVEAIEIINALPAGYRKRVRGWDFAASKAKQGTDPDWTVGVMLSRDADGIVYIEDVKRFRKSGNEVRKLLIKTAQEDGPEVRVRYPQDPGAAGKSLAEDYSRALAGFMFTYAPVTGAKDLRATPLANQVEAGNVKMLKADWNEALKAEFQGFPTAKHDDIVDAASDAFNQLMGVVPAEGLLEYYRQEAEAILARNAGKTPLAKAGDLVPLIAPPQVGAAYGLSGEEYRRKPDGFFWVRPEDVGSFASQPGWSRLPEPVT